MTSIIAAIYSVLGFFYVILFIFAAYSLYAMISAAPFVPTAKKRVKKMIALSGLRTDMLMMDLGSGDGRIVFEAAKTGARCVGIEINPVLYYWSRIKQGIRPRKNVLFRRESLWDTDVSHIDVLTIFFIHPKMEKLMKKLRTEMKPGALIVSYAFTFPGWPYEIKDDKIYVYRVES